ncbi:VOC family protein [Nonomuraea sp. NPDC049714]|uniref:VOC family protein n=1 Tax=Nonomuraea sp. NPDC049714 TaxID=3364357 RepID=UPI0037B13596
MLHHIGHLVHDMSEAIERYRRLGFLLPAPAYPVMPPSPGAAPEPFGLANTHAYFPRDFIELVTVAGGSRMPDDARPIPLNVPDDRLPTIVEAVRATAATLTASLRRFQGVHILMFDAPDLDAAVVRLDAGGVRHGGVHAVRRPIETADGTRMEPVRYLEFGTEGRVPEGRVGLAENPQPEALDGQRHTDHPNGAVGLAGCLLCVADADLAETEKRYAAYLGRSARQDGPARTFDGAGITLAPASALADLLPGERPPGIPGFAAYTVTVRDLPAAERMLRGNGVPLGRSASGDPFVPSAEALGVAIILCQAD